MSSHHVFASVSGLSCEATVVFERQTWTDPGGTTVEDIEIIDDDDGEELDFEELDKLTQEKVEEALIDAARDER